MTKPMQRERTRDAWKNIADEAHDYFCDQLASFSTSSTTAWKQVEVPSAENSVVAVFKTRGLNNNSNINPAREGSLRSQLPVYMGSGRIDGVHPEQVLALIRKSKSWDPWFKEGWICVQIDNDTTISYKAMKAVSKHVANERDLSLLEKRYDIADTADTTGGQTGVGIDYITLSADTMHIPRHPGRIRANLLLGAWRLELVRDDALSSSSVSTKITYVFQTDIRGSVPSTLTKRYLSKRASIGVAGLKRYFEKKGVTALMNSNKDRGFVKDPLLRLGETGSRRDVRQKKYIQPPISNGFTADCTSEYAGDEENSNDNHRHRGLSVATSAAVVANANYLITPPSSIRGVHPYPQQLHCEDGSSIDISTTNIISSLSASFSSSDDQLLSPDDSSLGLLSSPAHPPPSAPLPPIPVECTISSESSEAIDYFKSLLAKSDSCWNLASEQKGVKISFLSSTEGTSASSGNMPIVRGDFVWRDFSAKGFSIDDWMAAVTSAGARKIWDPRFEDSKISSWLTPNELDFHSFQKGTFPVSGRDVVGRQLLMHDALENKTYLVATSTSAQDSKFASLQHVRATLHLAGWMLSPNPENNSEIFVTYIVHIDPSGSIPSRLLKLVSTQTPLCIAGVYDYLNTHGTPMDMKIKCVEGVDDGGFVTLSKLDQSFVSESGAFQGSLLVINSKEKSDAESSLASASSLVVELNVCKYMYPGGVDLEISAMYRGNSNSTPTAVPLDTIINVQVGYNEKDIKLTVVNPAQLEYGGEYIISIKGTKGKRTSQRVFTLNGQPIAREETKAAEIAVVVDSMQSHKQRQLVSPTSEAPALASSLLPTTPGSCSNINSITFRDTRMLTKNTCTTTSLAPPSFPPHQHSRLIENVRQRMMHNILEFPPVEDTEKLSVSIADDGIIRADRVFRNVEDPSRFAESLFSAIQCQNSRRLWESGFAKETIKQRLNPQEYVYKSFEKSDWYYSARTVQEGVKSVGRDIIENSNNNNNILYCLSCSTSPDGLDVAASSTSKSHHPFSDVLVDLRMDAWVVLYDAMAKQVSLVRLVDKRDYKVDSVKVKNICQSMDGLILFVQRYGSPISFTLAPQPAVSTISYENRVNILSQSWSPINKSYDCQFEVLQIGEVEGGEQQLHSFNSSFHICDRAYPNGAVLDLSVRQRRRHCAVWMAMKDYSGVLSVGIASDNPSRLHCSILPQAAEQPAADYEVTMKISPSSRSTGKIKVGSSSRLTLLQTGASLQETPNAPSPPPPQLKKSHSKTVPHHHLRIFTTTGTASHPSNPSSLHRRLHGVGPSPASTTNTSSSSYLIISSPTSSAGSPMLMSPVQIKQEQQHILFVAMVQLFSLLYFVEKIFGKIIAICRHIPWPVAILLSAILIAAITKYFQ